MRDKLAIKNLREVKETFEKFGVKYWLDWGTLLGAIREQKLIQWDHDIDIGVMEEDMYKIATAIPELRSRGFNVQYWDEEFTKGVYIDRFENLIGITPYKTNGRYVLSSTFLWPESFITTFLYVLYSLLYFPKSLVIVNSQLKVFANVLGHGLFLIPLKSRRAISRWVMLIIRRTCSRFGRIIIPKHFFEELGTIEFYGMSFNIPSDVELYLIHHYGKDWRTPKREWRFEMDKTVKVTHSKE